MFESRILTSHHSAKLRRMAIETLVCGVVNGLNVVFLVKEGWLHTHMSTSSHNLSLLRREFGV